MKTRNNPPKIAILLLVLLVCTFVFLRVFPDFSFSIFLPEKETSTEVKPDTTPPVIACDIKNKTIVSGSSISVDKLGLHVTDASKIDSILFTRISSDCFYPGPSNEKTEGMKKAYAEGIELSGEEFQFTYGGIYELTITATDIYANSSDFTFTLKVETPPVIEAPTDFYVAVDTAIPYETYVNAWDVIEENYSFENITLDTSNLNIGKTGNYTVTFSGTDKYGLSSTCTSNVHVLSKDDLQELINTQKINATDHAIVGAYNKYDIGEYQDTSLLEEAMLPTLVQITNEKNDNIGDGFIIKIDDEFITIATNETVVADNLSVNVSFFDESTCSASVVFTNTEYNLAFIRIPIDGADSASSVSSDYVSSLRTVHLDETQWNKHSVTKNVSLKQLLRHYELVFKHKLQYK